MQKAAAILQFKLEGETLRRNPHFAMRSPTLFEAMDLAAGTVTLDGVTHPLLDAHFPTVNRDDPCALSEQEALCMRRLTASFRESAALWDDMRFVANNGAMYAVRDDHVIFHGCVPCDAEGAWLPFAAEAGREEKGRALFDAFERVVRRAFRTREGRDVDALYYLWAGARSPLFGKDRMATFETYLLADKHAHEERKNGYFKRLHEKAFCARVLEEFGARRPWRRGRARGQRARAGEARRGREAGEEQRHGGDHRRGFLRGVRRPGVHAGDRGRAHEPGAAPPLRLGRGGGGARG